MKRALLSKPLHVGAAVFVKTPGFSPLKTRLAADTTRCDADRFYELACFAVAEVLASVQESSGVLLSPYWAVAEPDALDQWRDKVSAFPQGILTQGKGGLGERLAHVYSQLLQKHDVAILIGADCPQITGRDILSACSSLRDGAAFALGPAADGGFYLMAGSQPLDAALWVRVPYSESTTAARLQRELQALGSVCRLKTRTDVDHGQDLLALEQELVGCCEPLRPGQEALLAWLRQRRREPGPR